MRKFVPVLLVVAAIAAFSRYRERRVPVTPPPVDLSVERSESRFRCDGRVYCSQMTSCEEATYFLRNCPGTKMDGEGDGIPCEKQWCGRH